MSFFLCLKIIYIGIQILLFIKRIQMDKYFKYKFWDLFNPLLQSIKNLGESASLSEIEEEVSKILDLNEEQINEIHRESTTKLAYRLAWARNYLKNYGLLENSARGIWSVTEKGKSIESVDINKVKKFVLNKNKKEIPKQTEKTQENTYELDNSEQEITEEIKEFNWQDKLLQTIRNIEPDQFERLCKRLLRELGFVNVEVTGKTNDGGIDGKGIIKVGSVLSFHVVFQSKRYSGSVSSSVIRDFRGAMSGRTDKGIILTTGTFTREAKKEALREGAIPIDLIDGNEFAEHLKKLNLGVTVEMIESVKIQSEWFKNI